MNQRENGMNDCEAASGEAAKAENRLRKIIGTAGSKLSPFLSKGLQGLIGCAPLERGRCFLLERAISS